MNKSNLLRRISGETFRRTFSLETARRAIDQKARTVDVSISSAEPIERPWGQEILDHSQGSIRTGRLDQGLPVLLEHKQGSQVGLLSNPRIEGGRIRGRIKFSRSALGQEILDDIIDGIRQSLSVAYQIFAMEEAEGPEGATVYRITDWEPLEASIVSVPADISVGVGRSFSTKEQVMEKDTISVRTIQGEARQDSNRRIEEISAIARSLSPHAVGVEALADRAILEGLDTETFRQMAIKLIATKPIETSPAHLGMEKKEVQEYSILRGLQAQISGDWRDAGLELECSRTLSERMDKRPKGFLVPLDIPFGGERTLTAGTATTGAEMVGTDHLAANFIDALRQTGYVFSLGPQILPGLTGNIEIPSMGDATFYHVAEDADVTDSTPATAEVSLSPKTLGGSVPMSRRFLKQSSPAAEGLMRNLLVRGATVEMEAKVLNGSGAAGQPTGILNTTGIGTSTIATPGQPTWDELVEFETDVLTGKGLKGSLAYLITPAVQGHCKTTLKASGVAGYLMEGGEINGYPGLASTNMPTSGILFGNFQEVIIGMWGGMDVKPDEATKAAAGGLVIRVFLDYDVGVGHAVSFSKNA